MKKVYRLITLFLSLIILNTFSYSEDYKTEFSEEPLFKGKLVWTYPEKGACLDFRIKGKNIFALGNNTLKFIGFKTNENITLKLVNFNTKKVIAEVETMRDKFTKMVISDKYIIIKLQDKFYLFSIDPLKKVREYNKKGIRLPIIYKDQVILCSYDNKTIVSEDIITSKIKWNTKLTGSVKTNPIVAESNIYFGTVDNYIYCLDLETGEIKWRFKRGLWRSPEVWEKKVYYFYTKNHNLYLFCHDSENGKLLHKIIIPTTRERAGRMSAIKLFIDKNILYFRFGNEISGLNLNNFNIEWRQEIKEVSYDFYVYPKIVRNSMIIFNRKGKIICLDLNMKKVKWRYIIPPGRGIERIELLDQYLFVLCRQNLIVLDISKDSKVEYPKFKKELFNSSNNLVSESKGLKNFNDYGWRYDKESILNNPIVYKDSLYFFDKKYNLNSLNLKEGKLNYKIKMPLDKQKFKAMIFDDTLYCIAQGYKIISLDLRTKKFNYIINYFEHGYSAPIIYKNFLLFSYSYRIVCLDRFNLNSRWCYYSERDKFSISSAAIHNGTAYCKGKKHIMALNLETGKELWRTKIKGSINTKPVINGDSIFIGVGHKYIICLNIKTGKVKWKYSLEVKKNTFIKKSLGLYKNILVFTYNNEIKGIDIATQKKVWTFPLPVSFYKTPTISSDGILYVNCSKEVYFIDIFTGKEISRLRPDTFYSPILFQGKIIVQTDNCIFCLK